ncbi:MAG TPA: hypothetical protein VK168_10905 [Saprospiraceae bacterium]|nr:hypothetical protein [Saprospiraceae bacterium]
MIYQAPIFLSIPDKVVQAIIDLDTGFIGFTELIDKNETIEYTYTESPVAYREALLNQLSSLFAEKSLGNFKVSRKNQRVIEAQKILSNPSL